MLYGDHGNRYVTGCTNQARCQHWQITVLRHIYTLSPSTLRQMYGVTAHILTHVSFVPSGGVRAALAANRPYERAAICAVRRHGSGRRRRLHATRLQCEQQQHDSE